MLQNYSHQTYHIASPIPCDLTLYRNHDSDEQSIIYYLHGAGGDERTWDKSNSKIISYWQSKKTPIPLVAAISFGPGWMLIPKNESQFSGYLEYFISTVMPFAENKAKTKIVKRYVIGYSMGGHSAAQLVLRYPEKFSKAALLSPAILPFSPYAEKQVVDAYIQQTKKSVHNIKFDLKQLIFQKDQIQENVHYMITKYKKYIPSQEAWFKTNIFEHIHSLKSALRPSIYISCGDRDDYGFFIGSAELIKLLNENHFITRFQMLRGNHMVQDSKAIVDFLSDN